VDSTIPCPGCGTRLNLSDVGCPICLRGRSPQEITRGYAKVRADDARRRRRPLVVTAWLAGLATAGYLALTFQAPALAFLHDVSARFGHFYDENSDPAHIAPDFHASTAPTNPSAATQPPPAAPAASAPAARPAPAPAPATSRPAAVSAAMAKPAGPNLSAPEPPLPHADASQWILHGRVYDLSTLEPIASASLSIKLGEGVVQTTSSNIDGYYAVVLPRLQSDNSGYTVDNRDPRYATAVHHEGDIPYRKLQAAERRRLIQNAQENDLHPSTISDIAGEEGVSRDLFLSPRQ